MLQIGIFCIPPVIATLYLTHLGAPVNCQLKEEYSIFRKTDFFFEMLSFDAFYN